VSSLLRVLGIRLEFTAPVQPVVVCADWNRLEDLLLSLISNAVRAIGRDGEILFSLEQKGGRVIFRISDNGGGADSRAMAEFFGLAEEETEVPEEPTLGLGLSLARRIAALHGGFVLADNYEGKGMQLVVSISDDLPDMGGGKTLRGNRPHIDEGGWSKALVELSECLPASMFVPEEFDA
jgi:signal transduction histidine kinase